MQYSALPVARRGRPKGAQDLVQRGDILINHSTSNNEAPASEARQTEKDVLSASDSCLWKLCFDLVMV